MTPSRQPGLALLWVQVAALAAQAAESIVVASLGHHGEHADTTSLVQLVKETRLANPEGLNGTHEDAPEDEQGDAEEFGRLGAEQDAYEKSTREKEAPIELIHKPMSEQSLASKPKQRFTKKQLQEDPADEEAEECERQLAAKRGRKGKRNETGAMGPARPGRALNAKSTAGTGPVMDVLDLSLTNTNLVGFTGGFTDNTYGYVVPYSSGVFSGAMARFDLATFSVDKELDLTLTDTGLKGFMGGFAGLSYGYLVPYIESVGVYSGKLARFDFATFGVVEMLDLALIDTALKGFHGGFAEGAYGYLVPYITSASGAGTYSGKVVRFELATFTAAGVTVLDLASHDPALTGFRGGFTDKVFGYCVPFKNSVYFGKVARFDLANFSTVGVLDLTSADPSLVGFIGGFAHDGYGYVVPYTGGSGAWKGKVARFPYGSFTSASVQVLDLTLTDTSLRGFIGGFTDGIYGYLVPHYNGAGRSGAMARFDLATFGNVEAEDMTLFDTDLSGFWGGFTDYTYAYVVPHHNNAGTFGKVARFGILPPDDDETDLVGDPHCVNLAREKFEIRAPGEHKLIQIPREPRTKEDLKLRVDTVLGRLEPGDCAGTFIESLLFSGAWTSPHGVLEILPGSSAPNTTMLVNTRPKFQDRTVSVKYGGVEFRVAKHYEGRYGKQKAYLNLRVKGLKKYDDVGGLLGKDDHKEVEKPPASCMTAQEEVLALHDKIEHDLAAAQDVPAVHDKIKGDLAASGAAAIATSLASRGRSVRDASVGSSIVVLN